LRRRQLLIGDAEIFGSVRPANSSGINEGIHNRLLEAIATLSPRSVEILILRYVYDYTEPQIATLLRSISCDSWNWAAAVQRLGSPTADAARLMVGSAGGILTGNGIGMGRLADSLQTQVDRPIIDNTNLPGLYDISLRFTPESDPLLGGPVTATPPGIPTTSDPTAPPLFSAIQDQLGLKLQPGTGTVEVIVIETVQKPSEN
jgi:hypothetical protein